MIWYLTIDRDNCRFSWGRRWNAPEPQNSFHSITYPHGHPGLLRGAKRMIPVLADAPLFNVAYFAGNFEPSNKIPVPYRIGFDLDNESGTGSPDASAGLPEGNFSICRSGKVLVQTAGEYPSMQIVTIFALATCSNDSFEFQWPK